MHSLLTRLNGMPVRMAAVTAVFVRFLSRLVGRSVGIYIITILIIIQGSRRFIIKQLTKQSIKTYINNYSINN